MNIKSDKHTTSEANGKTYYVDKRKEFALHQISPGDMKEIFYHNQGLMSDSRYQKLVMVSEFENLGICIISIKIKFSNSEIMIL